ncbi:MAG: hypothetical protein K9M10_00245 [Candidatus Pacebacteria bacterium]|nr:hypothetical protein [Candidatus Paceibacterota bacterium]MCF7856896.1 hypothetical protein [Candidatus Paceibacterota bacterium]
MNGSHIAVAGNGTVRSWTPLGCMESIIFPENEVKINGVTKVRGGAFVCSPFFGTQLQAKIYEATDLPKHGLIRQHYFKNRKGSFSRGTAKSRMWFYEPWHHSVKTAITIPKGGKTLVHSIQLRNQEKCPMPISLGFHPYLSTYGKPFEIRHGDMRLKSQKVLHDSPLFIPLNRRKIVTLFAGHNLITITMIGYTHICVWTDNKSKYTSVSNL